MYEPDQQPEGGPPQVSAFKAAEKRYQLCKEQIVTQRRDGKRRGKGFVVRPLDLSGVVDLQPGAPPPPGVTCLGPPPCMPPGATAYAFAAHPGLLVVRGALEPELQCQLVVAALTRFNEPPNHTTHTRAHPAGLPGLWAAAQQGLRLRQPQGQQEPAGAPPPPSSELWVEGGAGPTAASLLRRLRWATLGPPYDWTQRAYLRDAPHTPLPEQLRQLAVTLADLAHRLLPGSGDSNGGGAADADGPPAGASGQQQPAAYCPDAALVNFYYEGDTLNGHVDDAERCLAQPLVSLSLGCAAIFLIGAETKATPPTALLLRSGDAVVLSGPARRCNHGLPRVLTDQPAEALQCSGACAEGRSAADGTDAGPAFEPFARHIQACRINISIRDTR